MYGYKCTNCGTKVEMDFADPSDIRCCKSPDLQPQNKHAKAADLLVDDVHAQSGVQEKVHLDK